jgi:hypothetical protein
LNGHQQKLSVKVQRYSKGKHPVKERRATRRYKLSLRFEIWPESRPKGLQPTFFNTKDISSVGFYFESDRDFPVGSKFNFTIIFPREIAGSKQQLVNGLARTVRIERTPEDRLGVGILIESYKTSTD